MPFQLEEATIPDLHTCIRSGQTNVVATVQHYIERARQFNGVASVLVTEDGASIPKAISAVRATRELRFPTETVKASSLLPDLDKYRGPPLEFGRMESTASDGSRPPTKPQPSTAFLLRHLVRPKSQGPSHELPPKVRVV